MLQTYIECIKKGQLNGGIYNEEWRTRKGRPTRGQEQYINGKPDREKINAAKKKKVVKARKPKPPPEKVVMPFPPSNGKYYLLSEFFRIVTTLPKGKRNHIIRHLLDNKLVPVAKTTCYKVLNKYEKDPDNFDVGDDEWKTTHGRPDAFTDQEISDVTRYIHENPGHYDFNSVNELLVNVLRNRLINRGKDPSEAPEKISRTTRRNYMVIIASKLEKFNEEAGDGKKKKKGEVFQHDGNNRNGKLVIVST